MDIGGIISFALPIGSLFGFACGTFAYVFPWMVRQVYGLFRNVTLGA